MSGQAKTMWMQYGKTMAARHVKGTTWDIMALDAEDKWYVKETKDVGKEQHAKCVEAVAQQQAKTPIDMDPRGSGRRKAPINPNKMM